MSDDFSELEQNRSEYRRKMGVRDGISADQQVAIATLHNQAVARGSSLAVSLLLSKSTLRALLKRGLIDTRCKLTKKADDLLRKWMKDARRGRER